MRDDELRNYIPESCQALLDSSWEDIKSDLPSLAKDTKRMTEIESAIEVIPTDHRVLHDDSTKLTHVDNESVELVVTSPPYFDLKDYGEASENQLGDLDEYDEFQNMLKQVWQRCFDALVPGGRMCVVVGDVLRSRREHGRHRVLPLHSTIQEQGQEIGFDTLSPIIWYKIGNAALETGDNAQFLGKPYEPGAIVKNDIEYILIFRKPGDYRSPTREERVLSVISEEKHKQYFQQIWTDIGGVHRDDHPAPYPEDISSRLIRMFSFVNDTVLDPFAGSGTTAVSASKMGRNSISIDVEEEYVNTIQDRLSTQQRTLTSYKFD